MPQSDVELEGINELHRELDGHGQKASQSKSTAHESATADDDDIADADLPKLVQEAHDDLVQYCCYTG